MPERHRRQNKSESYQCCSVRKPIITRAPATSSATGTATPTAHNDQTGRKVSEKGKKYLRACCNGPSWKTFQTPAIKKNKPSTRRANSRAQARFGFGFGKNFYVIQ